MNVSVILDQKEYDRLFQVKTTSFYFGEPVIVTRICQYGDTSVTWAMELGPYNVLTIVRYKLQDGLPTLPDGAVSYLCDGSKLTLFKSHAWLGELPILEKLKKTRFVSPG